MHTLRDPVDSAFWGEDGSSTSQGKKLYRLPKTPTPPLRADWIPSLRYRPGKTKCCALYMRQNFEFEAVATMCSACQEGISIFVDICTSKSKVYPCSRKQSLTFGSGRRSVQVIMQIAIPADQRPVNELAQLRNGQLYSWVRHFGIGRKKTTYTAALEYTLRMSPSVQ